MFSFNPGCSRSTMLHVKKRYRHYNSVSTKEAKVMVEKRRCIFSNLEIPVTSPDFFLVCVGDRKLPASRSGVVKNLCPGISFPAIRRGELFRFGDWIQHETRRIASLTVEEGESQLITLEALARKAGISISISKASLGL